MLLTFLLVEQIFVTFEGSERRLKLGEKNYINKQEFNCQNMASLPLTFKFKKIRGRNFSVFHDIWKCLPPQKKMRRKRKVKSILESERQRQWGTRRPHTQLCFRRTWNNCGKSSRGSLIVSARVYPAPHCTTRFIGQSKLIFLNRSESKDDKLLFSEMPSGDNAVSC